MSDKIKIIFAFISFAIGVTLPLVGVVTLVLSLLGYIDTAPWVGVALSVSAFLLFFALGGLFLARIEDPSWFTVSLPYLFSTIYAIFPDLVPLQVDDAAAMSAGALLSFLLALRKNPDVPRWILIVLLLAAGYTFFGGAIPGPLDEFIVDIAALLIAVYGANKAEQPDKETQQAIEARLEQLNTQDREQ